MIRAHLSYLKYVFRHKWYVLQECQRVGITWRGIFHDLSKFSRAEWEPYVCTFYNPDGSKRDVRDATGHYDPTTLGEAFDVAWLHHIQHNPHHFRLQNGTSNWEESMYLRVEHHTIPHPHYRFTVSHYAGSNLRYAVWTVQRHCIGVIWHFGKLRRVQFRA